MESEVDTIKPETPSYRHHSRSRSPPRRFQVASETILPFDDSNTVVPETVLSFDDSNTVVPETVLPCDELNTVVPVIVMLDDKSFSVVPETVLPFDDSDMAVPEIGLPLEDSDSEAVVPRSQPRIVFPNKDKFVLQLLAIYCPAVLTLI